MLVEVSFWVLDVRFGGILLGVSRDEGRPFKNQKNNTPNQPNQTLADIKS
jgi:hypothetical protein